MPQSHSVNCRFSVLSGLLVVCCLLFSGFSVALGSEFRKGNNLEIGKLEQVIDDIYIYAQRLKVDGIIDGDLSAFAYQLDLNGEVIQSANLGAREIHHAGRVNGSLRAFAQEVDVTGYVLRSALLFGEDVTVSQGAVIQRDLTMFGANLEMNGAVRGNLIAKGNNVRITGVITGDVEVTADRLTIERPAVITGNLTYISEREAYIDSVGGVTISGVIDWQLPKEESEKKEEKSPYTAIVLKLASLFAAFIFGLLMIAFFRPYMESALHQVSTRFSVSLAAGLLGIVLLFMAALFFVIALICLLFGLILISGNWWAIGMLILVVTILALPVTSFASITGAVMFYTGKIILGMFIGHFLLSRTNPKTTMLDKLPLLAGLVVLTLLFSIPHVGVVFYMLASIIGLGAILLGVKNFLHPGAGMPRSETSTLPPSGPTGMA